MSLSSRALLLALGSIAVGAACSAAADRTMFTGSGGGATGTGGSGQTGSGGGSSSSSSGSGSVPDIDAGQAGGGGGKVVGDPTTCADAAMSKTYIGCDFWPTVTANIVWSVFDFAVVVANAGDKTANVTVTGPGGVSQTAQVAPNALEKIYLPWVKSLKGLDADFCAGLPPGVNGMGSVHQTNGAYHLVSDVPVTVYQFNALEYAAKGGAPGKDWSSCPASQCPELSGCFSFTNDASLLLPSTAWTGNYRIAGQGGWANQQGAFFTVTAMRPNTNVTVYVGPRGHILAGGLATDTPANGVLTFSLDTGDVVELFGDAKSDNAGSLVKADQPVQVISGMPCAYQPFSMATPACDHLEQTVLPAETLGKHYFVSPPTSPHGAVVGHIVRIVGNVDGTTLSYPGGKPAGAPATLDAGQVVELNTASPMGFVTAPFEIVGDHEFSVSTFMLAGTLTDPGAPVDNRLGDPSQSNAVTVEQYRQKYVFLAPDDYTESYADITMPMGATVTLDGAAVTATVTPISSGFGIARVLLGPGNGGAHVLTSSMPVGLQVIGYGQYTSYQYPGGLNLDVLAPPPPPPK